MSSELFITVDPNPNCEAVDGMVYHALAVLPPVVRMRATHQGRDALWWVTGVEPNGQWRPVRAYKITDSGSGVAYLIAGGAWGLRFALSDTPPRWDLADPTQWGEPYKIYGDTQHLVFEREVSP
ncbi:MAG: hypothetical protein HY600_00770 [Candidatus Omnitrophica bacterium]|nr:hypothetical protein [Candidatus Omnitrophota bacterium]